MYKKGQRVWIVRFGHDFLFDVVPATVVRAPRDKGRPVTIRYELPFAGRPEPVEAELLSAEMWLTEVEAIRVATVMCLDRARKWAQRATDLTARGRANPPGRT